MSKKDEIKQILIDMVYTADAKPRFINEKWCGGDVNDKLNHIDEAVDRILATFEPSPEDIAYEILCSDDEYPLKDMIELIEYQAAVNGSTMIDFVDGVQVWQKLELSFTCDEFLKHIGLKE